MNSILYTELANDPFPIKIIMTGLQVKNVNM